MRQRILTVLGVAVGLLVVYTLVFGVRHGGRSTVTAAAAASGLRATATQSTGAEEAEPATATEGEPGAEPAATAAKKAAPAVAEPVRPETWGTDPFVRDWVLVNELAELTLKAITLGGEKSYVLINDQILEEGDLISGKRIVLIESDKVVLEQGGRTFSLLLGE